MLFFQTTEIRFCYDVVCSCRLCSWIVCVEAEMCRVWQVWCDSGLRVSTVCQELPLLLCHRVNVTKW